MRCQYCYNPHIVKAKNGTTSYEDFLTFLKTRIGLLDAVVLSGGECTLAPNFKAFCEEIKKLNFKIKIDTNGTNPTVLKDLIENNLVDFIALDVKALPRNYKNVTALSGNNTFKTLELLLASTISFECRTTVHSDLHTQEDITELATLLQSLGYQNHLGVQLYKDGETLGNLSPSKDFDIEYLKDKSSLELDIRD